MYNNTATIYGTLMIVSKEALSKNGYGRLLYIETEDRGAKKKITLPIWEDERIEEARELVGEYVRFKCGVKIDEHRGTNYLKLFVETVEEI